MDILNHWGELVAMLALLVGFIVAVSLQNEVSLYTVIFIAGIISGRLLWESEVTQPMTPLYLIVIGFLLGYTIGAFGANRILIIIIFLVGGSASHYAHRKKWITV